MVDLARLIVKSAEGDTACSCGWLFPLSCMPMPVDVAEREAPPLASDVLERAAVLLVCPTCHKQHAFFNLKSKSLPSGGDA